MSVEGRGAVDMWRVVCWRAELLLYSGDSCRLVTVIR